MFLGPLSEFIGRRPIYIGSYLLFTIWFIPLATGHNIQTIIVARFLSGCSGAAGTTIVPGTQTDIWSTEERGLPVALFSLTAVLGTVAAPLYSGYINQYAGWRWIEWVRLPSIPEHCAHYLTSSYRFNSSPTVAFSSLLSSSWMRPAELVFLRNMLRNFVATQATTDTAHHQNLPNHP